MKISRIHWGMASAFLLILACLLSDSLVFSELGTMFTDTPDLPGETEERKSLVQTLEGWQPKGTYIVVDTALNELSLFKADQPALAAKCSTGSGKTLKAGEKSWTFETPRGEFAVQSRTSNPIWRKPDWAFLEEGLPVPPSGAPERYEKGVLGEYAFGIGNGYFIHGTLYTRLLGSSVTHGCIRLGPEDLRVVSKNIKIGTKVYIF